MRNTILVLLISFTFIFAQSVFKQNLNEYSRSSLSGNGVIDILADGDSVWFGLNRGLDLTVDGGRNFLNFSAAELGGKGGVAKILKTDDGNIWVSLASDTLIDDEEYQIGTGLSYTADDGVSWNYMSQPVDPNVPVNGEGYSDSLGYYPTTTTVSNITFDMLQTDNYFWLTSFGGGLRRALWPQPLVEDYQFEVITTNGKPFYAFGDLEHVTFSLAGIGQLIAVGSANGVSFSSDEGASWFNSSFNSLQSQSIPANFIVSLFYWIEDSSFWAGCVETGIEGESRGLAFTRNKGLTWLHVLEGLWVYSVNVHEEIVYASTDEGLFLSYDKGQSWTPTGNIFDFETGEYFTSTKVYCSAVQNPGDYLWVGTPDGLAQRDGNNWRIFRDYSPAGVAGEELAYAYPNPFSPERRDYVRFQFRAAESGTVTIGIYNFAMEKVIEIREYIEGNPSHPDRSIKWNGRNPQGEMVNNGVYFFRAGTPSGTHWGKIVIIN